MNQNETITDRERNAFLKKARAMGLSEGALIARLIRKSLDSTRLP